MDGIKARIAENTVTFIDGIGMQPVELLEDCEYGKQGEIVSVPYHYVWFDNDVHKESIADPDVEGEGKPKPAP